MLSKRAAEVPALMQSTPLVTLHVYGNVFIPYVSVPSTASWRRKDDIVYEMKWGKDITITALRGFSGPKVREVDLTGSIWARKNTETRHAVTPPAQLCKKASD